MAIWMSRRTLLVDNLSEWTTARSPLERQLLVGGGLGFQCTAQRVEVDHSSIRPAKGGNEISRFCSGWPHRRLPRTTGLEASASLALAVKATPAA
jgi:hypothetical protein